MKVIVLIVLLVAIVAAAPSANINEDQPTSLQEIESAEKDEETIDPNLESVDEEAVQYGFGKSLKKKIKKIGKQIEKVGKEVGKDAIAGVVGGLVG